MNTWNHHIGGLGSCKTYPRRTRLSQTNLFLLLLVFIYKTRNLSSGIRAEQGTSPCNGAIARKNGKSGGVYWYWVQNEIICKINETVKVLGAKLGPKGDDGNSYAQNLCRSRDVLVPFNAQSDEENCN